MTEATTSTFTPQLVYLSSEEDFKTVVLNRIQTQFGPVAAEQLIWTNEENGTLSIEMVRNLILSLSYAPFKGQTRHVVLVSIDQATTEAQNALLKLLEEPPALTQLWLTATHAQKILPTVLSRSQEVVLKRQDRAISEEIKELAKKIPLLSHRELSDLAGTYTEREDAKKMVDELSLWYHAQLEQSAHSNLVATIQKLLQTGQYLEANVNVKLALESCFFSLKKILGEKSGH